MSEAPRFPRIDQASDSVPASPDDMVHAVLPPGSGALLAGELADLEKTIFPHEPWSERQWRGALDRSERQGRLSGFCLQLLVRDADGVCLLTEFAWPLGDMGEAEQVLCPQGSSGGLSSGLVPKRPSHAAITGYAYWQILDDEAELFRIALLPPERGGGRAYKMLSVAMQAFAERGYQRCLLEVEAGNQSARRLYARVGFAENGCRRNYYGSGRDAILMERSIVRLGQPADSERIRASENNFFC